MADVVCFGEIMLRLTAPGHERLLQSPRFDAALGGAETNVAVALAGFGIDVAVATALPENPLGDATVAALRGFGVGTDRICRRGERMGIYYVETGSGYLGTKVIYDRTGSALATVQPGDLDWPALLAGARWLHISGITPALSEAAADATRAAVECARKLDVTVSCDANYRSKLWNYGASPASVMQEIVKGVDVLVAGADDFREMFDIVAQPPPAGDYGTLFETLSAEAMAAWPNLSLVAGTWRDVRGANSNGWSGCLRTRDGFHRARYYDIAHIADRIGTGDAFSAGLVYSLLDGAPADAALEFAVAAGCLNHAIPGDFHRTGVKEVRALLSGEGLARVQR